MITMTLIKRLSVCAFILIATHTHAEAQKKFTITPIGSNAAQVPVSGSTTVVYQVTNNLSDEFPLYLDMASLGGTSAGINQLAIGNNPCSVPTFSLKSGASCFLTLQINGAVFGQVGSSKTFSGPQICIYSGGPGDFSCSQPSLGQGLSVTIVPASKATISVAGSPLKLFVNGVSGNLTITNTSANVTATNIKSDFTGTALANNVTETGNTCASVVPGGNCTLTFKPGSNAVAQTAFPIKGDNIVPVNAEIAIRTQFAYVSNPGGTTVSICPITTGGSLGTCTTSNGNGTFNNVRIAVFNPTGTVVYVANRGNSTVSICPVNNDGSLGTCTTSSGNGTFNSSNGIALNPQGAFAYVNNFAISTVSICPIIGSSFGTCTSSNGNGTFSNNQSVSVNPAGTFAYVTNANNTVSICPIKNDGSFNTCTTSTGNGTFLFPQGVSFNSAGTIAYVGNFTNDTVSICPLNQDGSFGTCTTTTGNGTFNFSANFVIGLFMPSSQHFGYIPNNGNNTVSICPVNNDGSLGVCTTANGNGTFNQSTGVALNPV
jgi:DNA-binding beta-propeller fold protein YncE